MSFSERMTMIFLIHGLEYFWKHMIASQIDPIFVDQFDDANPDTFGLLQETDMAFFNGHFIFENVRLVAEIF